MSSTHEDIQCAMMMQSALVVSLCAKVFDKATFDGIITSTAIACVEEGADADTASSISRDIQDGVKAMRAGFELIAGEVGPQHPIIGGDLDA